MLRRKPSRVEERADVSDEYEYYLREKERRQQQQREGDAAGANKNTNVSAEQQAAELARQRRDNMRARLGLSSTPSMG